jgi:uncharacterized membrane protein YgcG
MKIALALGAIAFASLAACTSEDTTGRYSQALTGPPPGQCGEIETHVLGVYQTPSGTGTIYLDRKGKHALVLSAHEATTWRVKTAPDAELVHVYIVGYHEQQVDLSEANGTPDIIRDSMDTNGTAACGYSWPYDGKGCDTNGLLELAQIKTNMDVNSFAGCYEASTFKIGTDMAATGDCTDATVAASAALTAPDVMTHFFSCDAADTDGQCGGGGGGGGDSGGGGGTGGGGGAGGGGSPENGGNGGPVLF